MTLIKRNLRKSQVISTFGPGAIVDLRDESVMMAGIDFWPKTKISEIHEPNLERLLGVHGFHSPTTADHPGKGKDLPIVLFPEWLICPECHRLAPAGFFKGPLYIPESTIRCLACKKKVYPARLVITCKKGHIQDFPWVEWIKHGPHSCNCKLPSLKLQSAGRSASLSDLIVSCINKGCGGYRSLAGATQKQNLSFMKCGGKRPWLKDTEPCDEEVIPLQRGASNVYFSKTHSSISIPPWSEAVHGLLNNYWSVFKFVPNIPISQICKCIKPYEIRLKYKSELLEALTGMPK